MKAPKIITAHKLIARSHGEAELNMGKFRNALKYLHDVETPYDPMMAKIYVLYNTENKVYITLRRKH